MKKGKLVLTILVGLCLMASCNSASNRHTESALIQDKTGSKDNNLIAADIVYDLKMVTGFEGVLSSPYSGNSEGAYQILDNLDGSVNILYTDYVTHQRIFLSNKPDSTHYDESDTSWIENGYGGCIPIVAGDKLYVFKFAVPSGIEDKGEDALGCIYQSDLNGANRKQLLRLEADEEIYSSFAYDGDFLYCLLTKSGEERSINLIKIDINSGSKTIIKTFEDSKEYFIVGAYQEMIIIKEIGMPEVNEEVIPEDFSWEDSYLSQEHTLYAYTLTSGEYKELKTWKQDELIDIVHDGVVYFLNCESGMIDSFNLATGQETSLAEKIELKGQVPQVGDVFDNHLILYVYDSDVTDSRKLAVDLETGKVKEITLMAGDVNANILAETKTHFLVTTGLEIIELDDVGPDGQPTKIPFQWQTFSLISKEDYWNNNPNYEKIDDDIF